MSYGGYGGGRGGPPPSRPGAPGRPTMSPTMGRGGAPRPPNTTNPYATTRGGGGRTLPTPGSGGGQKKVKAIYDFFGQGPNDLSFKKGDIINVVSEDSTSGPDWWVGEIKGKRGEFPHNHVEPMDDSSSSKPSYNNSSYTNNSSYGNSSYTPPGPSVPMSTFSSNTSSQNNYPSKPTPRATDDDKPSKPSKSFSGGGGGLSLGDFGDKIPTIGLSLAIICFIFFFVGMCFPWYRTSTLNNNKTRFWGWTGINEYPIYSKSFANPWTTSSIYFRPYKGVLYPTMKSVFDTSFAFCLMGMGALLVQLFLWFRMKQGNLDNNRIIFIAVMVTFLCFLIGFFQIFRFQKAWRAEVDKTCTVTGPCKSWLGKSATYGDWGPALGWWLSLIGFFASTANAIIIYIRVHSDGGILQLFGR